MNEISLVSHKSWIFAAFVAISFQLTGCRCLPPKSPMLARSPMMLLPQNFFIFQLFCREFDSNITKKHEFDFFNLLFDGTVYGTINKCEHLYQHRIVYTTDWQMNEYTRRIVVVVGVLPKKTVMQFHWMKRTLSSWTHYVFEVNMRENIDSGCIFYFH